MGKLVKNVSQLAVVMAVFIAIIGGLAFSFREWVGGVFCVLAAAGLVGAGKRAIPSLISAVVVVGVLVWVWVFWVDTFKDEIWERHFINGQGNRRVKNIDDLDRAYWHEGELVYYDYTGWPGMFKDNVFWRLFAIALLSAISIVLDSILLIKGLFRLCKKSPRSSDSSEAAGPEVVVHHPEGHGQGHVCAPAPQINNYVTAAPPPAPYYGPPPPPQPTYMASPPVPVYPGPPPPGAPGVAVPQPYPTQPHY